MKTVKVNKVNLLEIVTKNCSQHRDQFEKAFDGYRRECVRILNQNLDSIKSDSRFIVRFCEEAPEDHTKDYERVIAMLNMSVDEVVELTSVEFQTYVQDDWSWKTQWTTSNAKYYSARL